MRNNAPAFIASGTIQPSTFVTIDPNNDLSVLQCGANGQVIGIAQVGDNFPPGVGTGNQQAAVAGEQIQIFSVGDVCLLQTGTASGLTRGAFVKSDFLGNGVAGTADGSQVGAVALESCNAGEQCLVQVVIFVHG